jgi:hypothetical protein
VCLDVSCAFWPSGAFDGSCGICVLLHLGVVVGGLSWRVFKSGSERKLYYSALAGNTSYLAAGMLPTLTMN